MSKFVKFIQESYKTMQQYSIHEIPIVVKDELVSEIDLGEVASSIAKLLPKNITDGLDIIYVGHFEELQQKQVNAVYIDGAIYVTNIQTSVEDMVEDIVHEFAHFVEEKHREAIYGHNNLEKEFLHKRNILFDRLEGKGYNVPEKFRHQLEYQKPIDDYLYKFVGYPLLRDLIPGLFISAYSVTDVREYFAISFENYFMGNKNEVRDITPSVYIVLEELFGENYGL